MSSSQVKRPLPTLPVSAGAVAGFAGLVLLLSSLRFLPLALAEAGRPVPAVVDGLVTLLGGGVSPLWALLLVGVLALGAREVGRLLRESVRVRVGAHWYVLSLIVPPVAVILAMVVANGGWPDAGPDLEGASLPAALLLGAVGGLVFSLAENVGWRAWLQRGLQAHVAPLSATVLVGVVWGLWHLPLFFMEGTAHSELSFGAYLPMIVVVSVAFGALFNRTEGALMPVVVAHTAVNLSASLAFASVSPGTADALLLVLAGVVGIAMALVIWRTDGAALRPA